MDSNRETNSELNYSEEMQEEQEKETEEEQLRRKILFRHRLSERKLPAFLRKNRESRPTIKGETDIEETKNKIIQNLESIKIFDINKIANKRNHNNDYNTNQQNTFNIYKYIDERKNIREKLSLYHNNLESDDFHLIECLSLEPIKRTKFEHKYIKNYLMKTSLMQSLLNLNENKRNITKILNKICLCLKYKFIYAGKTIYEINSIPVNYYYIIEGKVQALKPEKINIRMTGFEYFTYIMRLKRDNENYLIDLILKNQTNFVIHKEHLPILNYIFFMIIYKEFCNNINFRFYFKYELDDKKNNYESPLEKMINLCFCNKEELLKDINLNQSFIESKWPLKELEKLIQKNIPQFSDDLLKYYRPMALDKKLFDITLFKYKSIVDLKKGSFFGESTNAKHSLREYTLKTVEDCHLSYLEIEIYDSFLKIEKEKITSQMVDYLYEKFFFNTINESEFKNRFFQSFVFEVKELGKKLGEQDNKLDYIYFIKEGEISINCTHSVNSFINDILNPLKENNHLKYNEEFIELITLLDKFLKKNRFNYNLLSYTALFIAISKSIIGLDSLLLGFNNYIYDAISNSVVKYFKIEKKYLLRILREYSLIKEVARNEAIQSILLFIDRFIKSLILKRTKKNYFILSKNNVKLNLKNIKLIDYENKQIKEKNTQNENNIINGYFDEDTSINNTKILKKYIINYNQSVKQEKDNNSENLIINLNDNGEKKTTKEKNSLQNNSRNKLSLLINNSVSKFRNLEKNNLDILKHELNKATIKNETMLVNMIQKNLVNNLIFSKPKFKTEKAKSNNNILKNKSLNFSPKKKIKLKPLNNENENSIRNLKYNINSQESSFHNNTEKDNSNSNSIIKTYRSIKTNIKYYRNINEDKEEYSIFQDEEESKIIPRKDIKTIEIKETDKLLNKNLSPIHKKIMKKNLSNLQRNFINNAQKISYIYKDFFKSFSSLNNISKKEIKGKNNIKNHFLLYRAKKDKYKILKEKILKQNYWN